MLSASSTREPVDISPKSDLRIPSPHNVTPSSDKEDDAKSVKSDGTCASEESHHSSKVIDMFVSGFMPQCLYKIFLFSRLPMTVAKLA